MTKPNVIILYVDALRFDHISERTPHLQRFLKNGITANYTFSTGCPTQISAPSLFTSTKPLDEGGYSFGILNRGKTIAEVYKQNGYQTFGVVGGASLAKYYGYHRGFDHYEELFGPERLWRTLQKVDLKYYLNLLDQKIITLEEFSQTIFKVMFLFYQELIEKDWVTEKKEFEKIYKNIEALIYDKNFRKYLHVESSDFFYSKLIREELKVLFSIHEKVSKKTQWKAKILKHEAKLKKIFSLSGLHYEIHPMNYSADRVVDRSISLLQKAKKNYFLLSHFMDAHDRRWGAKNRLIRKALKKEDPKKEAYERSLYYIDHCIGKFFNILKEQKLDQNTIFCLVSDHGQVSGNPIRPGIGLSSCSFHDEFIHVPMAFIGNGISPQRINQVCSTMDLAPTLLDLCDLPKEPEFQGVSILDSSTLDSREVVTMEHMHRGPCDWGRKPYYFGFRTSEYKYVWKSYPHPADYHQELEELYDVQNDPEERKNIIESSSLDPRVLEKFRSLAKKRLDELSQ